MSRDPLELALLDLGLEDWIPIPEAVQGGREIEDALGDREAVPAIRHVLESLVRDGSVLICRGPWNGESERVDVDEALQLLEDERWFRFRLDDPNEERLYFVNRDNVRDEPR